VIRLGDAVGTEVKSECSLFQAAGLSSDGLSVGTRRGGGRGHSRKAKSNDKGGKFEKRNEFSVDDDARGSTDCAARE